MKRIVPLFLMALVPFFAFGQKGYQQDLNHVAVITFPDTPKATVENDKTVYAFSDSGIIYVAMGAPYHKGLKDIFAKNLTDSLYEGVIIGSLQSSNGKLLYRKPVEMNGLKGLEFGYIAEANSVKSYRYHQTVYLNNTLIFLGYWSKDSLQTNDKGMRSFFNSFKLKVNRKDIIREEGSRLAYSIGKGLGYVIIALVIVLLALGVVFLVRKFS